MAQSAQSSVLQSIPHIPHTILDILIRLKKSWISLSKCNFIFHTSTQNILNSDLNEVN